MNEISTWFIFIAFCLFFILVLLLCWIVGKMCYYNEIKKNKEKINLFNECYTLLKIFYNNPSHDNYLNLLSSSAKLPELAEFMFDITEFGKTTKAGLCEVIRRSYYYLVNPVPTLDQHLIMTSFSSIESVFIQHISLFNNTLTKLNKKNFLQKILKGIIFFINIPINIIIELGMLPIRASNSIKNSYLYKTMMFIAELFGIWELWEKLIIFIRNY